MKLYFTINFIIKLTKIQILIPGNMNSTSYLRQTLTMSALKTN